MLTVGMFKPDCSRISQMHTLYTLKIYHYSLFVDFQYQAWHRGMNIPDQK